jgi:hypothetical protein
LQDYKENLDLRWETFCDNKAGFEVSSLDAMLAEQNATIFVDDLLNSLT